MRFFNKDGQSKGTDDAAYAAVLLADGWVEVQCLHPGAQEIVWKRADGTISVTEVMPHQLAQFDFVAQYLARDPQAAATAVIDADAGVQAAAAALTEAVLLVQQGNEANRLRTSVQSAIATTRDQCTRQLSELNARAFTWVSEIEARDAELATIAAGEVAAQTSMIQQQALDQEAVASATAAQSAINDATVAIALADQQIAVADTVPALTAAFTASKTANVDLAAARQALADAQRTSADARMAMDSLQQVIAQAQSATAERATLLTQRQARTAQDAAAADAIRAAADQAVAALEQQDAQLAALQVSATRAEQGMSALQAELDTRRTALAAAQQLVADIARATQLAASEGTSIEEHAQRLQARGAVPADWALHAIHPAGSAWRPAGVDPNDLVVGAQGAVVYGPNPERVAGKLRLIDAAAEQARMRYCPNPLQAQEYLYAFDDAVRWLDDQAQPVPATVQEWATIKGWAPQQAASNIKTSGDALNTKLVNIRSVRLNGKAAVAAGSKTVEQVLAELEAL